MTRMSFSEGQFDPLAWILILGVVVVAFLMLMIAGTGSVERDQDRAATVETRSVAENVDFGG